MQSTKQAKASFPRRNQNQTSCYKEWPCELCANQPTSGQAFPTSCITGLLQSRQEGLWIVFCRWFSDWLISENKLLWLPAALSDVGMWTP